MSERLSTTSESKRLYSSAPEGISSKKVITAIEEPTREKLEQVLQEMRGSGPWSKTLVSKVAVVLQIFRTENPDYSSTAELAHELGINPRDQHIRMIEEMSREESEMRGGWSVSFYDIKYCALHLLQRAMTNQELMRQLNLDPNQLERKLVQIAMFCTKTPSFVLVKNNQDFVFDETDRTYTAFADGTWAIRRKKTRTKKPSASRGPSHET